MTTDILNDLVYSNLDNNGIKNNIKEIVDKIYSYNNDIKIYVESIYPVNTNVNEEVVANRTNSNIKKLNKKIKKICTNKCTYINMYNKLLDNNGNLKRIFTVDGLHLNKIGYIVITKEIKKYLN